MNGRGAIGISRAAYTLPATRLAVEELERAGRTASPAAVLRDFGFDYCYCCPPATELSDLVVESGKKVLQQAGRSPKELDRVFLYSALTGGQGPGIGDQGSQANTDPRPLIPDPWPEPNPLELFRYPAARAHHLLGLGQTPVMGLSQLGCSGLLAAVHMASQLLQTTEKAAILCLAGDMLPPGGPREIMYNVMSDAAGALLIERGGSRNRIVHFHERVQTYYWDTPLREQELLAAYFPMAQRVISECLQGAGLEICDVKWFVPHNVSLRSWHILAKLMSIPTEKVWTSNIARVGHTLSCDHIINLVDMEEQGALSQGDYLVLFTFGFGASWSCMVMQH
jgi:3-oxoacyl-[acyl-carrier-protein] synthase III